MYTYPENQQTSVNAARSQHDCDTYITQRQPAWERTIALCSATRQTIELSYSRSEKHCRAYRTKCVHTSSLFISTLESGHATIQQFGLDRYQISRRCLSHLTVTNTVHRQTSLPRSQCHTSGIEPIFIQ